MLNFIDQDILRYFKSNQNILCYKIYFVSSMGSILSAPSSEEEKALLDEMQKTLEGIVNNFYEEISMEVQGSKYIPIHKILHQEFRIRCSVTQECKIAQGVSEVINNFMDKKYAKAIGNIIGMIMTAMLGSVSASSSQRKGYSIGVGLIGGVIRIDYLVYLRQFAYEGLISSSKNMAVYAAVISSADMTHVSKNDIKALIDVNYGSVVDYETKKLLYERVLNPIDPKYFKRNQQEKENKNLQSKKLMSQNRDRMSLGWEELQCLNLTKDFQYFKTIKLLVQLSPNQSLPLSCQFRPQQEFTLKNLQNKIKETLIGLLNDDQSEQKRGFFIKVPSQNQAQKFNEIRLSSIDEIYASFKMSLQVSYKNCSQFETVQVERKSFQAWDTKITDSLKRKWGISNLDSFQILCNVGNLENLQHFSPQEHEFFYWAQKIVRITDSVYVPRFVNKSSLEKFIKKVKQDEESQKMILVRSTEATFVIGQQQIANFTSNEQQQSYRNFFQRIMNSLLGGPFEALQMQDLDKSEIVINYDESLVFSFFKGDPGDPPIRSELNVTLRAQNNQIYQNLKKEQQISKDESWWRKTKFQTQQVQQSPATFCLQGPLNSLKFISAIPRRYIYYNHMKYSKLLWTMDMDSAQANAFRVEAFKQLDQIKQTLNSKEKALFDKISHKIAAQFCFVALYTTSLYPEITTPQLDSHSLQEYIKKCKTQKKYWPLAFLWLLMGQYLNFQTSGARIFYRGFTHYALPNYYGNLKVGDIQKLQKITSFSQDKNVAEDFLNQGSIVSNKKLFQKEFKVFIQLESDTMKTISLWSIYPDQKQGILHPGAIMRCKSKKIQEKDENGQKVYYVTLKMVHIPTFIHRTMKCYFVLDLQAFKTQHALMIWDNEQSETIITNNLEHFSVALKEYTVNDCVYFRVKLGDSKIKEAAQAINQLQLTQIILVEGSQQQLTEFKKLLNPNLIKYFQFYDSNLRRLYRPLQVNNEKKYRLFLDLEKSDLY